MEYIESSETPEGYSFLVNDLNAVQTVDGGELRLGWTADCCGKRDFDPFLVTVCSRAYSDGYALFSVVVLGKQWIKKTAQFNTQSEAVKWIEDQAKLASDRISALLLNSDG